MTVITPAQAFALARGAGFDPASAAIMTAIAGPESGYRTDAMGDIGLQDGTWGPSVGLWQIRSLKAQNGTGGPRDVSRLTDPTFNAASAKSIYDGQGLHAWSTFTSGAYLSFLPGARTAAATGGSPLAAGASTTAQNAGLGPLSGWNPFAWPGQLAGSVASGVTGAAATAGGAAASAVWAQIGPFLITWGIVAAGAGLVVIGAAVTAWPTTSKAIGLGGIS